MLLCFGLGFRRGGRARRAHVGYGFYWAFRDAEAAVDAERRIYDGEAALHGYGLFGAGLDAEGAAYAACGADFFDERPLERVAAADLYFGFFRDQRYDAARAFRRACSAADAFFTVYYGYAVFYADRAELAYFYACAVAQAAVGAGGGAFARDDGGAAAVVEAHVDAVFYGFIVRTAAFDEGDHRLCGFRRHA